MLPLGPAMLAVESGAPAYGMPSGARGRPYRRRLEPDRRPCRGSRRERVTATMTRLAAAFEDAHRRRPRAVVGGLLPDLAGSRGAGGRPGAPGGGRGVTDREPGRPDAAGSRRHRRAAAPTCTSTRSPVTGRPASRRSSSTSSGRPTSTSSRSRTTSGSMRRVAARAMAARPRPSRRGRRRRGGHDPRRPPAGALPRPPDPAVSLAPDVDPRRPRGGRAGHPGPSARAVPALRPGLGPPPAARRPRPAPPIPTPSRRSIRRVSAGRWHRRVVRFADEHGLAHVGNSDAHALEAIGTRLDAFPGRDAAALRRAIETRQTQHGGSFHGTAGQLGDVRAAAAKARPGRPRRGRAAGSAATAPDATTATPAAASGRRATSAVAERRERVAPMKIGLVCPYIYPESGRRRPARPVPLREPAPARPRRPDHHRQPRPAARVRGRHPAHRRRLQHADQRLGRDADVLAALHQPGARRCSTASASTSSTSTSRSCRSCRSSCCASRAA